MNIVQCKDTLLFFVSQWVGTTIPRLLAAFAGLVLLTLCTQKLWDKRIRVVPAILGMMFGAGLVITAFNTHLLHWLTGLNDEERLRMVVGFVSTIVLGTTLEVIRRAHLQERYAILWIVTGCATLLGTLFPASLSVFGMLFGTSYTTSILLLLFIFVLLVLFQFSIALSRSDHRESKIAQRCALMEERLARLEQQSELPTPKADPPPSQATPLPPPSPKPSRHKYSGAHLAATAIIAASCLAVFWTGWCTPSPMIGDEVTHFYMLKKQAANLSTFNFMAEIPVKFDENPEIRGYPHVNGWHYLGAIVYRLSGDSFRAVQLWHTLFWVQFLVVAYLFARRRGGNENYASILYLLALASLPAAIIFAIPFYQDIPVTAQVLTAFYLLSRHRRWWALFFLMFAIALKETAFLFIPVFVVWWVWTVRAQKLDSGATPRKAGLAALLTAAVLISLFTAYSMTWSGLLHRYAHSNFYPVESVANSINLWVHRLTEPTKTQVVTPDGNRRTTVPAAKTPLLVTSYEAQIIANHPGDLRLPRNYFIFGGALIWLIALVSLANRAFRLLRRIPQETPTTVWLWSIGLSFILPAAYILRTAPDARFFLPAIPFLLLALTEWASSIPRIKLWLALTTALVLLQVAAVHAKVYTMRKITPEVEQVIHYLEATPPSPRYVFMYPEGSFRLFPTPHNWYLDYHLREFWKGDNEVRLTLLRRYKIGAIIIKKSLIAEVDDAITDLGVFPTYFVRDIQRDPRFKKVFENAGFFIYSVPQ